MLALTGIYQNGTVIFEQKMPFTKSMKVIVTFVDENFAEYEKIFETYLHKPIKKENNKLDLNKFSFQKSINATQDINCSFSDALIEERRAEQ